MVGQQQQQEEGGVGCDTRSTTSTTKTKINEQRQRQHEDDANNNVVYLHVHVAKTAGSSFNRYMSRNYFAVCGNKGSSHTERWTALSSSSSNSGSNSKQDGNDDDMLLLWHNCKFISHEGTSNSTIAIARYLRQLSSSTSAGTAAATTTAAETTDTTKTTTNPTTTTNTTKTKVHLLVPCRDPLSHTFSFCSHKRVNLREWDILYNSNNNNKDSNKNGINNKHNNVVKSSSGKITGTSNDETIEPTDTDDLCTKIIQACHFGVTTRFTREILKEVDTVTMYWYSNYTHLVDSLLAGDVGKNDDNENNILPKRTLPLPYSNDGNVRYETNKFRYSSGVISSITKQCGQRIYDYYMNHHVESFPYYQQCKTLIETNKHATK